MRTDPVEVSQFYVTEADSIRAEMLAIVKALDGRKPTRAMMRRARQLRDRMKTLEQLSEKLYMRELAIEIVVRQRLGRTEVEGESISDEDLNKADALMKELGLC